MRIYHILQIAIPIILLLLILFRYTLYCILYNIIRSLVSTSLPIPSRSPTRGIWSEPQNDISLLPIEPSPIYTNSYIAIPIFQQHTTWNFSHTLNFSFVNISHPTFPRPLINLFIPYLAVLLFSITDSIIMSPFNDIFINYITPRYLYSPVT